MRGSRAKTRLLELFPVTMLSWRNLTRTRTRTALATLGIVVGVVAIASLGVTGVAFERSQVDSFDRIGSTVLVEPGEDMATNALDSDDLRRVQSATEHDVYAMKSTEARVSYLQTTTRAELKSVNDVREQVTVASGRIPLDWRDGVLVGADVADELDVAAGDAVSVGGERYRILAVLAENEGNRVFGTGGAVVVPEAQHPSDGYQGLFVETEGFDAAFEERDRLDEALNYQTERYEVTDFEDEVARALQTLSQINVFIVGIGAVSLFVASVSIMNVMLMSTIERRGEIGVFRAVGYQRLDVLRMMLAESLLIGLVGSVVGVALSFGVGLVVNDALLGDPTAFTGQSLAYFGFGFLFGVAASVVSGLYPAWRAASDPPVESLRG
jgi:putative ABC transport system permease protein